MDTILLVLYKNLNCALDKTIDTGHTTDINYDIIYDIQSIFYGMKARLQFFQKWAKQDRKRSKMQRNMQKK